MKRAESHATRVVLLIETAFQVRRQPHFGQRRDDPDGSRCMGRCNGAGDGGSGIDHLTVPPPCDPSVPQAVTGWICCELRFTTRAAKIDGHAS